jgi:hypothetical protein
VYDYVGPPLTRESLAALLDRLGVQPTTYSLYGAHLPEADVMDHRREGWVVFFTERGDELDLMTYMTEADACLALLNRVTSEAHNFFELVAGPALPDVADRQFQAWLHDRSLSRDLLTGDDWKTQDSPWIANEPDYRRYWIRTAAVRRLQGSSGHAADRQAAALSDRDDLRSQGLGVVQVRVPDAAHDRNTEVEVADAPLDLLGSQFLDAPRVRKVAAVRVGRTDEV